VALYQTQQCAVSHFRTAAFVALSSALGEFGLTKGARVENKRRGQLAPKSALSEINVSCEH